MCLRRWLCGDPGGIGPPNGLEGINVFEINTILQAAMPGVPLYISDMNYKTTTKEELERFLREDLVDSWKYVPELYDCDDYSFALMGHISNPEWGALPFGILWTGIPGGGHAVNIFIDNDRKLWIVEPQNDSIFELPDDWEPWFVVM